MASECFDCGGEIARHDGVLDALRRYWHRRCAGERLVVVARPTGGCPGCGGPVGATEEFVDAIGRRWHKDRKPCVSAALATMRAPRRRA